MSTKTVNSKIISPYTNKEIPVITNEGPLQASIKTSQIITEEKISKKPPGVVVQEVSATAANKFPYNYGYVEAWEEQTAIKLIEEHLGFPRPRVYGYNIIVKIYVRPSEIAEFTDPNTGEKKYIYAPETATARDKFVNCTGLVLAIGPWAFQDKHKYGPEPWCRVGEWVVFPRNHGTQVNYRGVPIQYIPDDSLLGPVEDPEHVTRD